MCPAATPANAVFFSCATYTSSGCCIWIFAFLNVKKKNMVYKTKNHSYNPVVQYHSPLLEI